MAGDSHDNLTHKHTETKESPTFGGEFYNSAMYSAFEAPALGLTQLVDKTGTKFSEKVSSAFEQIGVSAPKQESLSTGAWLGRTIGGAVGMMAPVGLLGMGSRGLLSGLAPSLLTERTAIGLSLGESVLTGGVYGTFLTPSEGKNLLTERLIGGAGMATSFGLLSGSGLAMSKFGATETAARWGISGALRNPISAGILSGAPAGLINAETDAVQKGDWIFSKEDLGKQMLQMSIVGGIFGAKTQLFAAHAAEAPVNKALADEGPIPDDAARSGLWQPEMRSEWQMPPEAVASFRAQVTDMLERRQREANLPKLTEQEEILAWKAGVVREQLSDRAISIGATPESLKRPHAFNYYHMKEVFPADDNDAHSLYRQLRELESNRAQLSHDIYEELHFRARELTRIINSAAPDLFPNSVVPIYKVGVHEGSSYGMYDGAGQIQLLKSLVLNGDPKLANTLAHEAKHGEQEGLLIRKYIDRELGDMARPSWDGIKHVAGVFQRTIGAIGTNAATVDRIFTARLGERLTDEELARANKLEESMIDFHRGGVDVQVLQQRTGDLADALNEMDKHPESAIDSMLAEAAGNEDGLQQLFGKSVPKHIADFARDYDDNLSHLPAEERLAKITPVVEQFRQDLKRAYADDNTTLQRERDLYRYRYHEKEAYSVSAQVNGGPLQWLTPEEMSLNKLKNLRRDDSAEKRSVLGLADAGPMPDGSQTRLSGNERRAGQVLERLRTEPIQPNDKMSTDEANAIVHFKTRGNAEAKETADIVSRRGPVASLVAQNILRMESAEPLKRDQLQQLHEEARDAVKAYNEFRQWREQGRSGSATDDRVSADEAKVLMAISKADPNGTAEMLKWLESRGPVSLRVGQKLVEGIPEDEIDRREIENFDDAVRWVNDTTAEQVSAEGVLARARQAQQDKSQAKPVGVEEANAIMYYNDASEETAKELATLLGAHHPVEKLIADRFVEHGGNPIDSLWHFNAKEDGLTWDQRVQRTLDNLRDEAKLVQRARRLMQKPEEPKSGAVPYGDMQAYAALRNFYLRDESDAFASRIKQQYGPMGEFAVESTRNWLGTRAEYNRHRKYAEPYLRAVDCANQLHSAFDENVKSGSDRQAALAKAFEEHPIPDELKPKPIDRPSWYEDRHPYNKEDYERVVRLVSPDEMQLMQKLAEYSEERAAAVADLIGARGAQAGFAARYLMDHRTMQKHEIADGLGKILEEYGDALGVANELRQTAGRGGPPPADDVSLAEAKAILTLHTGHSKFWDITRPAAQVVRQEIRDRGPNSRWVLKYLNSRDAFSGEDAKRFSEQDLTEVKNAGVLQEQLHRFQQDRSLNSDDAYDISHELGPLTQSELADFVNVSNRLSKVVADPKYELHSDAVLNMARDPRVSPLDDAALPGIYARTNAFGAAPAENYTAEQLAAAAPAWELEPSLPTKIAAEVGALTTRERMSAAVAWADAERAYPGGGTKPFRQLSELGDQYSPEQEEMFQDRFKQLRGKPISALVEGLNSNSAIRPVLDLLYPNLQHRNELAQALQSLKQPFASIKGIKPGEFDAAYEHLRVVQKDALEAKEKRDKQGLGGRLVWTDEERAAEDQLVDSAKGALQLTQTFGGGWKEWLAAQENAGRTLHDATYYLPTRSAQDMPGLGQFLRDQSFRQLNRLELIAKRWDEVPEEMRTESYDDIIKHLLSVTYPDARDAKFAEEAASWGVSPKDYYKYEQRYLDAKDKPTPFPVDKVWREGNLIGRFIPRDDPRGVFLGKHTNCCQHPDNEAGAKSAWNGQENPNAGFFVVEVDPGKNATGPGQIIAQSWSWISDNGGLVFDNVEALKLGSRQAKVKAIYQKAADDLKQEFPVITIGAGNGDLNLSGMTDAGALFQPLPAGYKGNSDAKDRQVLLAKNPQATRAIALAADKTQSPAAN